MRPRDINYRCMLTRFRNVVATSSKWMKNNKKKKKQHIFLIYHVCDCVKKHAKSAEKFTFVWRKKKCEKSSSGRTITKSLTILTTTQPLRYTREYTMKKHNIDLKVHVRQPWSLKLIFPQKHFLSLLLSLSRPRKKKKITTKIVFFFNYFVSHWAPTSAIIYLGKNLNWYHCDDDDGAGVWWAASACVIFKQHFFLLIIRLLIALP